MLFAPTLTSQVTSQCPTRAAVGKQHTTIDSLKNINDFRLQQQAEFALIQFIKRFFIGSAVDIVTIKSCVEPGAHERTNF